jgi:hypothetical protein
MNSKSLSKLNAELAKIIMPKQRAVYATNFFLRRIVDGLQELFEPLGGVDFTPDYQRGHVWTDEQQTVFIEDMIRGYLPPSLLQLQFNCPHFEQYDYISPDLPRMAQCVDGLQRYTAMKRFIAHEIRAFGLTAEELNGTDFSVANLTFSIAVYDFKRKKDVLRHYLRVNTGGTPHSPEEIARVRQMYDACED